MMKIIGRKKTKTALFLVIACVIWLGLQVIVCPVADAATGEITAADPNAPADSNVDPNTAEEGEDVFSPKISTLVKINQGFEAIFNSDYVTEDGLVRYADLRRKRSDLNAVIRELNNLNPMILMSLSPTEKTAFWINTYNACVLNLVIDHYPIEHKIYMIFYPNNSIMQITGDWRSGNKHLFQIQGLQYNLQEIEQDFLLDRTQDPRVLFALHYGSMGGGLLRNEPYTTETLDDQLNDQVKRFLADKRGMKIDKNKNTLYLSSLFSIYKHKEFFEDSEYVTIKRYRDRNKIAERGWLNFIHDYLEPEDLQYLKNSDFDIKLIKFDWLLNEAH
ncbi:MAG: DUF547 domain-containing protein [Planctomycetota bacterium]|jgi:hypothetical protein